MKYKGKQIVNNNVQIVVIPRKDENIVFHLRPVLNTKRFDDLVKMPEAPSILMAGSSVVTKDTNDAKYKLAMTEYFKLKSAFTFLESISATPDLEWETVNLEDPKTWLNWQSEFEAAEFTESEKLLIFEGVQKANSLNSEYLDEVLNDFLASQVAEAQ